MSRLAHGVDPRGLTAEEESALRKKTDSKPSPRRRATAESVKAESKEETSVPVASSEAEPQAEPGESEDSAHE